MFKMDLLPDEVVNCLVNICNFRFSSKFDELYSHIENVVGYTRIICTGMGLKERATEEISKAALLHDIGKLCISEDVLFKPGRLTDDEFKEIKKHIQYGYEILKYNDTPFFRLAADIALQHHERMDGKGYMGLKGNEICLPARIVAVADVFEALVADRCYRKAWDFETAFSYIVENRGTHFDEYVVDRFVQSKDLIFELYQKIKRENAVEGPPRSALADQLQAAIARTAGKGGKTGVRIDAPVRD